MIAVLAAEGGDVIGLRGIDPGRHEAVVTGEPRDGAGGAIGVVVGDDHALEEAAARRDRDDRAADAAGTDDEDPHPGILAASSARAARYGGPAQVAGVLPLEGAGVAVAEGEARAAGQVPLATGHVRAAIHDRKRERRPLAGFRNVISVPHGSVRWATPTSSRVIARPHAVRLP